jgi:hypothetical protein
VQSHYEGVRDVSARFAQTTHGVRLGTTPSTPATSSGKRFAREARQDALDLRGARAEPRGERRQDRLDLRSRVRRSAEAPRLEGFLTGAAAQFLLGAGDMRRDFKVAALSVQRDRGGARVDARVSPRPTRSSCSPSIRAPATWQDADRRSARQRGRGGVQEQRFNLAPSEAEFQFEVPAGVKVIELAP